MNQPANRSMNIAHRGGANLWPENTLEAFENAINAGVDGIECDIQRTRDDRLVIHHDDRLKPEATRQNGTWLSAPTPRLRELARHDLDALDVGRLHPDSAYSQIRAGQMPIDGARIPDFDAVNQLIAARTAPEFRLYAELKTHLLDDTDASARHLADLFCTTLAASPVRARTHVVSFDWRCLDHVRAAFPDQPHAYTTLPFFVTDPDRDPETPLSGLRAQLRAAFANGATWMGPHDWRDKPGQTHGEKILGAIAAAGGHHWFAFHQDITPDMMACATRLKIGVSAWSVNAPADMQRLVRLGVRAIITDRPDLMRELRVTQN